MNSLSETAEGYHRERGPKTGPPANVDVNKPEEAVHVQEGKPFCHEQKI